ncbi:hypothetical protein ACWGBH_38025, partial [Streptomyces massasporeus]
MPVSASVQPVVDHRSGPEGGPRGTGLSAARPVGRPSRVYRGLQVTDNGAAKSSWAVTWSYAGNRKVTNAWAR